MIRLKFPLIVVTIALFIISCEENLSPIGKLPDKYSVNIILRTDTVFQTAYLSKIYMTEDFNPNSLEVDPFVSGAKIMLKYQDVNNEYVFNDTVDNSNTNDRYNTPAKYYYLNNFIPSTGKEIQLTVDLPDGSKLSSKTKLPEPVVFDLPNSTPFIPGPFVGNDTQYVKVAWTNGNSELIKAGKVTLIYYYRELSGEKTKHVVKVPLSYIIKNNIKEPVYVNMSYDNNLNIDRSILEEFMHSISEGNESKARYSIAPLEVDIYSFDENLSRYYSANLFFDFGFTVRNFPGDINNIVGGYGFFGAYSHTTRIIKFDQQYLMNTFGYMREVTN